MHCFYAMTFIFLHWCVVYKASVLWQVLDIILFAGLMEPHVDRATLLAIVLVGLAILGLAACFWCHRKRRRRRRRQLRPRAVVGSTTRRQHVCDELGERFASVDSVWRQIPWYFTSTGLSSRQATGSTHVSMISLVMAELVKQQCRLWAYLKRSWESITLSRNWF